MTTHEPSLDEAKAAVLFALQQAVEEGLPDADASELAAQIHTFEDTFALDEWVFEQQPALKKRLCRYPLCFNPPRPPAEPGPGQRPGGNPPAYCADGVDHDGVPHNGRYASQRSIRRRSQLRAAAAGKTMTETESTELAVRGDHPVSRARSVMAGKIVGIERGIAELTREMAELRAVAERSNDETARWAEIESIQLEANQLVQKEVALRLAAEERARLAEAAASRMADDLGEANSALEEAFQQTGEAEQRRAAAVEEATEARSAVERITLHATSTVEWLAAEARWHADKNVHEATTARDKALAAVEERENAADLKVQAADTAAREARQALTEASSAVRALQGENTALRDKAISREREFEETIARLHEDYQEQLEQLRDRIEMLRTKAEEAQSAHEQNMNTLRDKHEAIVAQRVAEVRETMSKLHAAEIKALRASDNT